MGALQAQDFNMAKWAIGCRLPHATVAMVDAAVEKAEIIRTHVLRPTWHFVSADDIYWMLELSAPQIKTVGKSRDNALGITESQFQKSNHLLEKALNGGKQLTRAQLTEHFNNGGIELWDNRLYHFLMRAEIEGIIFSKYSGTNKQTYSLLREAHPNTQTFTRDEALAELAKRYFASHGPATVHDFAWWSGLSLTDCRKGLAFVAPHFVTETIDGQTYYLSSAPAKPKQNDNPIHLLPAFDEYLISYKNRTAAIELGHQSKAFSNNGIFKPIIVENGKVVGIWKQTIKKERLLLETDFFQSPNANVGHWMVNAAKPLGAFLNKEVEVDK